MMYEVYIDNTDCSWTLIEERKVPTMPWIIATSTRIGRFKANNFDEAKIMRDIYVELYRQKKLLT